MFAALPAGWTPRGDTVVHGDLYARHLLFEDGRLGGVIDWGDVHLGDPVDDLSIARGFLPAAGHEAFREAYGAIDEEAWSVARFRALHSAVLVVPYAQDRGDRPLLREGLLCLEQLSSG